MEERQRQSEQIDEPPLKKPYMDKKFETILVAAKQISQHVLQLHRDCNLSIDQIKALKESNLFTIDLDCSPYNGYIGLGRHDFDHVFDPYTLQFMSRAMCCFTTIMCPYGGPTKLQVMETHSSNPITIDDIPIKKGNFTQLLEGCHVVIHRGRNFHLKYQVVKRGQGSVFDSTIGVLFAAPLVETNRLGEKIALPELDFRTECSVLQRVLFDNSKLKETILSQSSEHGIVRIPRSVDLRVHFGTKESIKEWSDGLQVLHISGHGNDHCVYFESANGVAVAVSPHEIASLIQKPLTLKLVFVATCASENIAQAFVDLGVPHVVCTKANTELEDKAAIAFTRTFYEALVQGRNVGASFTIAQNTVASLANTRQPQEVAKKFQLLPTTTSHQNIIFPLKETIHLPNTSQNDVNFYSQVSFEGMDESIDSPSTSPPDIHDVFPNKLVSQRVGFGYRNLELHQLLERMLDHRLVTITGEEGIGKTQLAIAAAWYLDMRQLKRNCIKFCFLGRIIDHIMNDRYTMYDSIENTWNRISDQIYNSISLNEIPTLIIFDGCDIFHDATLLLLQFEKLIEKILNENLNVRILITSRCLLKFQSNLLISIHSSIELYGLSLLDGAKLFQRILNKQLILNDFNFLKLKIPKDDENMTTEEMAIYISTSPYFIETNGNPNRIIKLVERLKFQI